MDITFGARLDLFSIPVWRSRRTVTIFSRYRVARKSAEEIEEEERQNAQQEKLQTALSNLLTDKDNKYCAECNAKLGKFRFDNNKNASLTLVLDSYMEGTGSATMK